MSKSSLIKVGLFALTIWSLSACSSSSGCSNNDDCTGGDVCLDKKCQPNPFGTGTDSETTISGTDPGYNTDNVDSDSQTSSGDSDADTDSDSASDSDSQLVCAYDASVEDGHACGSPCDCFSGHCDNGFCCDAGECCGDAADCNGDLCAKATCMYASCEYYAGSYECGVQDLSGEQCGGSAVCDGEMNCVAATDDCGFFAATGNYDCSGLDAVATCYDYCTVANQATNCAAGAICFNGVCRPEDAKPDGTSCMGNDDCQSAHCQNGYCCAGGDCCASTADCSDECRTGAQCDTDTYKCIGFPMVGCGKTDTTGSATCSGDNRCDGAGSCLPVLSCLEQANPFGSDSNYTCGGDTVNENCRTSCTAPTHCVDGASCDFSDNLCKMDRGEPCDAASDCYSGYCNNGYCCTSGTCCAANSDCSSACAGDAICNASLKNCEAPSVFEDCGAQTADCSGSNRCDGDGNCVAAQSYCGGNSTGEYTCGSGSVVEACSCTEHADCDDDGEFCNGVFMCGFDDLCRFDTPVAVCQSTPCDSNRTCDEASDSCLEGVDPCDAEATDCDSKRCMLDGLGSYSCEDNFQLDGSLCDDGDPCTGNQNVCLGGVCEAGTVENWACDDNNPCTNDNCSVSGDKPICNYTALSQGAPCDPDAVCFSSSATCEDLGSGIQCVDVQDVCAGAGQGICKWRNCANGVLEDEFECTGANVSTTQNLSCGEQIVLEDADFETQFYTDYGSCGGGYLGREVSFALRAGQDLATEITNAVLTVSGSRSFSILRLSSNCIALTCEAASSGSMSNVVLGAHNEAVDYYVIDYADRGLPGTVTVSLTCP